ncbi:hypothetical protein BDN67DRAFT_970842 [Paxillus ammoniavirescens]|nr:hypothetical protein BDN67DRAFT_970842 [Paxillus ammoniavirescens]
MAQFEEDWCVVHGALRAWEEQFSRRTLVKGAPAPALPTALVRDHLRCLWLAAFPLEQALRRRSPVRSTHKYDVEL